MLHSFPTRGSSDLNILLVLVDDLGYGDLSSYGAEDLQTPHVDAIVRDGMRFDEFYANCPVCSPTRAALLTGRYQELVGVPGVIRTHAENSWGHLTADATLLPARSEEHTSELQSRRNLVCRLLLEKKKHLLSS